MLVTVQILKLSAKIKFIETLLESVARGHYFVVKIGHSKMTVFKWQRIGRKIYPI